MNHNRPSAFTILPYAVTIFFSAFLLFEIQPMMAKFILPWFGGAAGVWAICLVFFQILLLGGYAYVHGITRWLSPRAQNWIHLSLLACSALLLAFLGRVWETPITPGVAWKPQVDAEPALHILKVLTVSIGLPFFVLSSTSPLLQSWFSRIFPGPSPYRFYALSNLGSLLALVGYPFAIERLLPLKSQARDWSWAYCAFALVCGYCAAIAGERRENTDAPPDSAARSDAARATVASSAQPSAGNALLWLGLAACGSTQLLATTNHLSMSVAAVPFLWMLPLGLYLLSFVICFEHERWYRRGIFQPAFAVGAALATFALYQEKTLRLAPEIGLHCFALFAGCMVCHGELSRSKPDPRHLTKFYLLVAVGGALGGVFVSLVAPVLFDGLWEYHLALWTITLLLTICLWKDEKSWVYHTRSWLPIILVVATCLLPVGLALSVSGGDVPKDWRLPAMLILGAALLVKVTRRTDHETDPAGSPEIAKFSLVAAVMMFGGILSIHANRPTLDTARNFYGVLAVVEANSKDPEWASYRLRNGMILHGAQFRNPAKKHIPTTYYGSSSAVGLVLLHHPRRFAERPEDRPMRIGVVGLGVGTIAAYGQPGDVIRFYEINPDVIEFADSRYFSFLRDTPARVEIIEGDARVSMEAELARNVSQQFDVLVLDAFSSDSIPVHLLTREAFELYLRHLRKPDGAILVHISNTYIDLRPVMWKTAELFHLSPAWIYTPRVNYISSACDWVVLAPNRKLLDIPEIASQIKPDQFYDPAVHLWTDDYSNLFRILKR